MELLKKLRIDTGKALWLVEAPENCIDLFSEVDEIKLKLGSKKPVPQLILFATDSTMLNHYIPKLADYIAPETLFWIFSPKKSGSIQSDLASMKDMTPWNVVFEAGYRGQTSVAVNDDWTGLRVTNAPPKKPSTYDIPPELRNIEGIDFVNRTVTLPADAAKALSKHKGMTEFFNAMAFTHKKEYVQAIVEAKKEETRARRIEKTVEMLAAKMMERKG